MMARLPHGICPWALRSIGSGGETAADIQVTSGHTGSGHCTLTLAAHSPSPAFVIRPKYTSSLLHSA
jgi:hypothetical protein